VWATHSLTPGASRTLHAAKTDRGSQAKPAAESMAWAYGGVRGKKAGKRGMHETTPEMK